MSLYAIKDKDGELRDTAWDSPNITREFYAYTGVSADDATREAVKHRDSRVVELVEKAEPVEVGKSTGEMLAGLKREIGIGGTHKLVTEWLLDLRTDGSLTTKDIFRALDIGWTVKQPKRWYVKVPKEWDGRGERHRLYKRGDDSISNIEESNADNTPDEQFTAEEIERYRLGGFEKVGVED